MKNGDKPINPIVQEENIGQGGKILMCTEYGLTKREHYAGLAMQGLLANCNGGMTSGGSRTFSPNGISELALLHADELLKQLENK